MKPAYIAQRRHGLAHVSALLLDDVEQFGRRALVFLGLLVRVDGP